MDLGEFLKKRRKYKRLTQTEVAEILGYSSPQFVSLYETGKSKVPLEILKTLKKPLGLNLHKLYLLKCEESKNRIAKKIFGARGIC